MHFALRVPISAAGLLWGDVSLRAQPAELPPIFAQPSAAPIGLATPTKTGDEPPSRLSTRVRRLMTTASERVLAEAKPFEITAPNTAAGPADISTMLPGEAVMLPRYVVKSTVLRRAEVQRLDLPPFGPYIVEREGRPGMVKGYTFPVWRSRDGFRELNLNLIDFAGRGVDHAKDFGRVELEFKIRF